MRPIWTVAVQASICATADLEASASLLATITVPSSSTSITVPVVSWIMRMFLPPGPIKAPIFSGSILSRIRRGANGDNRRGDAKWWSASCGGSRCASRGIAPPSPG